MTTSTGLDTIRGNAIIARLIGESEPAGQARSPSRFFRASLISEARSDGKLTSHVSLMRATVAGFEPSLELLTELYSKGALAATEIETRLSIKLVLAISMLAAAQLCDIDSRAVRINAAGIDFVERLASGFLKPVW